MCKTLHHSNRIKGSELSFSVRANFSRIFCFAVQKAEERSSQCRDPSIFTELRQSADFAKRFVDISMQTLEPLEKYCSNNENIGDVTNEINN